MGGVARRWSSAHSPVHPHLLPHRGGFPMAFFSSQGPLFSRVVPSPPLPTLIFSLLSKIQVTKGEGSFFFVPLLVQRDCIKVRNTHPFIFAFRHMVAICIKRKMVTSRQGQVRGQGHNRGVWKHYQLSLGGPFNNGRRADSTISGYNARALSNNARPPQTGIGPQSWRTEHTTPASKL